MKHILRLILVLPLFFIIAGCESEADVSPVVEDVLMPLKINNKWIYAFTFYDSTGNVTSEVMTDYRIEDDSMYKDEKVYIDQSGHAYANRQHGLWFLSDITTGDTLQLAFKYPCMTGDTYVGGSFTFLAAPGETMTVTVASTDESVISGGKSYSCIKYIAEGYHTPTAMKTDRRVFYFSPKVGLILVEDFNYFNHPTEPILFWRQALSEMVVK
jgi:hypothetical protein